MDEEDRIVDLAEKKRERAKPTFCLTLTAQAIMEAFEFCRTNRVMGGVFGRPGIGKTETIKHYAAEHGDVAVATMLPSDAQLHPAMQRVRRALGRSHRSDDGLALADFTSFGYVPDHMPNMPANHVHRNLLLIDEAQYLDELALGEIRSIPENGGCGICFIGNGETAMAKGKTRKAAVLEQFRDRLVKIYISNGVTSQDVAAFCNHHSVVGTQARDTLIKFGMATSLRQVGHVIGHARTLAGGRKAIELRHVQEAMAYLNKGAQS